MPHPMVCVNVLLAAALVAAVASDSRSRRIPNALTVPVAAAGLALNGWASGGSGVLDSLGGLALGMALLLPVWLAKGTSAGDVKLLGMVGALRGVHFALYTTLFAAVAGGVVALLVLLVRGGLVPVVRNAGRHLFRMAVLNAPGEVTATPWSFHFPYALAIALGAAVAALWRW